jgi:hypothetical protein
LIRSRVPIPFFAVGRKEVLVGESPTTAGDEAQYVGGVGTLAFKKQEEASAAQAEASAAQAEAKHKGTDVARVRKKEEQATALQAAEKALQSAQASLDAHNLNQEAKTEKEVKKFRGKRKLMEAVVEACRNKCRKLEPPAGNA